MKKLPLISVLCAFFVLIFASKEVIVYAKDGLSLCMQVIIPTLFPFFVMTGLLSRLGLPGIISSVIRRLLPGRALSPAAVSSFVVGICGGYPMGAAYIAEGVSSGAITTEEAEWLLSFCSNSGPSFIIAAAGAGIFGSVGIGLLLYGVHIISALLTGLLFSFKKPKTSGFSALDDLSDKSIAALLPNVVRSSIASMLSVCGFVIIFSVLSGLIESTGLITLASPYSGLFKGFIELGNGIGALRGLAASAVNVSCAAAILGFGSLSVYFQTLAVISDTNIKGTLYLPGRLVCAAISAVLAFLSCRLLRI